MKRTMAQSTEQLNEKRMTLGWLLLNEKTKNAYKGVRSILLPRLVRLCLKWRLRLYNFQLVRASTNDHRDVPVFPSPFHVRRVNAVARPTSHYLSPHRKTSFESRSLKSLSLPNHTERFSTTTISTVGWTAYCGALCPNYAGAI